MDANLNWIDPVLLHQVWPTVLPGLEKVRLRSRANWLCEDVYAALRSQHSLLYTAHIDGAYVGFVVLTPMTVWDGNALHIWCAHANRPHMSLTSMFLPRIEEIALSRGSKRITAWSPRRWERHIAKHGFEAGQVEYTKELR